MLLVLVHPLVLLVEIDQDVLDHAHLNIILHQVRGQQFPVKVLQLRHRQVLVILHTKVANRLQSYPPNVQIAARHKEDERVEDVVADLGRETVGRTFAKHSRLSEVKVAREKAHRENAPPEHRLVDQL